MTISEMELVARFKQKLEEKILPDFEVIVYGSRARGDNDSDSDLDVLVITSEAETPNLQKTVSECAWDAYMELNCPMVLVAIAVSRKNWEDSPERYSPFSMNVRREGISV
jgi:hypothetical protein